MSKNLIYTTFRPRAEDYEEYNCLISEWIISLRTLGNYQGKVILFNYSDQNLFNYLPDKKILGDFEIIQLEKNLPCHMISNRRNVDVINHLLKYKGYNFSHIDADVWFQKDINSMFETVKATKGMCFAVEHKRSCNFRNGQEKYLDLFNSNINRLNGFIFGGWFAGVYNSYISHLRKIKLMFDEGGWDINMHGSDQSLLNVLVDFEKDDFTGLKWAASQYYCYFKNGKWKFKHNDEDVFGIHLVAYGKNRKDSMIKLDDNYRFKYLHKEIYDKHIKNIS